MQSYSVPATALAVALTLAVGAEASPSYKCRGNLTLTERTICDHQILGDLDRAMANFYYATRDDTPYGARKALSREQALWLRWRDTCGGAVNCLRRRYEQRIIDLSPPGQIPPGFGCAESPYGGIHIRAELLPPDRG